VETWAVTGASGSIGSECIVQLIREGNKVIGFSRKSIKLSLNNFFPSKVKDYEDIDFNTEAFRGVIIAQGFFHFGELKKLNNQDLENTIEANFVSQIQVVKNFLKQADESLRTDVVILGSTSAFQAGRGTTVYGAAKAGMLGFVRALNEEYKDTDIRFWFVSTGTLSNEMGAKVPNQDPSSLLDPELVAKRIIDAVTSENNLWEPEITIRRRHIKLVN
jgi:3-oxoacyl-[acyl-carrier protein] reductase